MYSFCYLALESHMGRLDKLEFEDVINRNNRILKLDAHDVYQVQFDWSDGLVYLISLIYATKLNWNNIVMSLKSNYDRY